MLLKIENIKISFEKEKQKRFFKKERQEIVKDVSLELLEGDCLGVIGESGSGKSTLGKCIIGLLKPDSGSVILDGINMYRTKNRGEIKKLQKLKSVVFQDYTSSVNIRFKVKDIIGESLRVLEKRGEKLLDENKEIKKLLEDVGLNESFIERYPHELSGGQLQRVCIARALAIRPKLILLDEAISSLDASTQTQIMDLLLELQKKYNLTYIFITHDLPSVTYMCNKVIFFKDGKVIERVDDIYKLNEVKSEYALKLLNSILEIG